MYYNDNKDMKAGISINDDGTTEEAYDGSVIENWENRIGTWRFGSVKELMAPIFFDMVINNIDFLLGINELCCAFLDVPAKIYKVNQQEERLKKKWKFICIKNVL